MLSFVLLFVGSLSALASAHYEGYPFKHQNEGVYGAEHPYANYGPGEQAPVEPPQVDEENRALPVYAGGYPYGGFFGYYPYHYGTHHGFYGYGRQGYNHEFDYRGHPGFPVHQGHGQFYFLGDYKGHCDGNHDHGVYFADDKNSFVVCVFGRSHRFQCPKGTENGPHEDFQQGHSYGLDQLCGVNTLAA